MKSVAFFSEIQFTGKYPTNFPNARTDVAWQIFMDADHYCIYNPDTWGDEVLYDVGIIILPKTNLPHYDYFKNLPCDKIFVMQEGPNWYWQDWSITDQILYLNFINSDVVTGLLCHNISDISYYSGLTKHPVFVLQTAICENALINRQPWPIEQRKNAIIGGNMVSWYGGMDSFLVAKNFNVPIYCPTMGRAQADELKIEELNHIPYNTWSLWMGNLSNFKYAVHLMRTHAAGTFALNCAYYGIPCIGYYGLDTQEQCHPFTTVSDGDLFTAKKYATLLATDDEFYKDCADECRKSYDLQYSKEAWLKTEFAAKYLL